MPVCVGERVCVCKVQQLQYRGDVYLVLPAVIIVQNDIIMTTSAPGQLLQWDVLSLSLVKMNHEVSRESTHYLFNRSRSLL